MALPASDRVRLPGRGWGRENYQQVFHGLWITSDTRGTIAVAGGGAGMKARVFLPTWHGFRGLLTAFPNTGRIPVERGERDGWGSPGGGIGPGPCN